MEMKDLEQALKSIGAKSGLEIELDETGACALQLSDGRTLLIQERGGIDELDFVATLGRVPEKIRGEVFTGLLSANFYWQETCGATLSWNEDLEEAVIMYPLPLAGARPETVEEVFTRFLELQAAWAERFAGMVAAAQERGGGEDGDGEEEDGGFGDGAGEPGVIINP